MFNSVTLWVSFFILSVKTQDLTKFIDIDSLSELPLDSLLNVRKNILQFGGNNSDEAGERNDSINSENIPEALPLLGTQKLKNKGYYVQYPEEEVKKPDKKKLSSIFQLSVTTLAFLAFGGYLIYLVIAAITGKNYNYMYDPNATQIMSALINAQVSRKNKKKRTKRPIRGSDNAGNFGHMQGYNRKRHKKLKVKREILESKVDPEMLYNTLTDLCEGYSKFYGLDDEKTNYSSCYYNNRCK